MRSIATIVFVCLSVCLFVVCLSARCLSVCQLAYFENQTYKFHQFFLYVTGGRGMSEEKQTTPWFSSPLTEIQYVMYFRFCE